MSNDYTSALESLKNDLKVRYASNKTPGNFGASSSSGGSSTSGSSSSGSSSSPAPKKLSSNSVFKSNDTPKAPKAQQAPQNPNAGNVNMVTGEDGAQYRYNPRFGEYVRFITIDGKVIPIVYDPKTKQGVEYEGGTGGVNFSSSPSQSDFGSNVSVSSPAPSPEQSQQQAPAVSVQAETNPDRPSFAVQEALDLAKQAAPSPAPQPSSVPSSAPISGTAAPSAAPAPESSSSLRDANGYIANPQTPRIEGIGIYNDRPSQQDAEKVEWVANNSKMGRASVMDWIADARNNGVSDVNIDAALVNAEEKLYKTARSIHVHNGGKNAVASFGYNASTDDELRQAIHDEIHGYMQMSNDELASRSAAFKQEFTDWRNTRGATSPFDKPSTAQAAPAPEPQPEQPPIKIPRRRQNNQPPRNQKGTQNGQQTTQPRGTGETVSGTTSPTEAGTGTSPTEPSPEPVPEPADAAGTGADGGRAAQPNAVTPEPEPELSLADEIEQAKQELAQQAEQPAKPEPKKRGKRQAKAKPTTESAVQPEPTQAVPSAPVEEAPVQEPPAAKEAPAPAQEPPVEPTPVETAPVEATAPSESSKPAVDPVEQAKAELEEQVTKKAPKRGKRQAKPKANAEAKAPAAAPETEQTSATAEEQPTAPAPQAPVAEQPVPKEAPVSTPEVQEEPSLADELEQAKAELAQQVAKPEEKKPSTRRRAKAPADKIAKQTQPEQTPAPAPVEEAAKATPEANVGEQKPSAPVAPSQPNIRDTESYKKINGLIENHIKKDLEELGVGEQYSGKMMERLANSPTFNNALDAATQAAEERNQKKYDDACNNLRRIASGFVKSTAEVTRDINSGEEFQYLNDALGVAKNVFGEGADLKAIIKQNPDAASALGALKNEYSVFGPDNEAGGLERFENVLRDQLNAPNQQEGGAAEQQAPIATPEPAIETAPAAPVDEVEKAKAELAEQVAKPEAAPKTRAKKEKAEQVDAETGVKQAVDKAKEILGSDPKRLGLYGDLSLTGAGKAQLQRIAEDVYKKYKAEGLRSFLQEMGIEAEDVKPGHRNERSLLLKKFSNHILDTFRNIDSQSSNVPESIEPNPEQSTEPTDEQLDRLFDKGAQETPPEETAPVDDIEKAKAELKSKAEKHEAPNAPSPEKELNEQAAKPAPAEKPIKKEAAPKQAPAKPAADSEKKQGGNVPKPFVPTVARNPLEVAKATKAAREAQAVKPSVPQQETVPTPKAEVPAPKQPEKKEPKAARTPRTTAPTTKTQQKLVPPTTGTTEPKTYNNFGDALKVDTESIKSNFVWQNAMRNQMYGTGSVRSFDMFAWHNPSCRKALIDYANGRISEDQFYRSISNASRMWRSVMKGRDADFIDAAAKDRACQQAFIDYANKAIDEKELRKRIGRENSEWKKRPDEFKTSRPKMNPDAYQPPQQAAKPTQAPQPTPTANKPEPKPTPTPANKPAPVAKAPTTPTPAAPKQPEKTAAPKSYVTPPTGKLPTTPPKPAQKPAQAPAAPKATNEPKEVQKPVQQAPTAPVEQTKKEAQPAPVQPKPEEKPSAPNAIDKETPTFKAVESSINRRLAERGYGNLQDLGGLERAFEVNPELRNEYNRLLEKHGRFSNWWRKERATKSSDEIKQSDAYKRFEESIKNDRDGFASRAFEAARTPKDYQPVIPPKVEQKEAEQAPKPAPTPAETKPAAPAPTTKQPEQKPASPKQEAKPTAPAAIDQKSTTFRSVESNVNKRLAERGQGSLADVGGLHSVIESNPKLRKEYDGLIDKYSQFATWWDEKKKTMSSEEIQKTDAYKKWEQGIKEARNNFASNAFESIRSNAAQPESKQAPAPEPEAPKEPAKTPAKKPRVTKKEQSPEFQQGVRDAVNKATQILINGHEASRLNGLLDVPLMHDLKDDRPNTARTRFEKIYDKLHKEYGIAACRAFLRSLGIEPKELSSEDRRYAKNIYWNQLLDDNYGLNGLAKRIYEAKNDPKVLTKKPAEKQAAPVDVETAKAELKGQTEAAKQPESTPEKELAEQVTKEATPTPSPAPTPEQPKAESPKPAPKPVQEAPKQPKPKQAPQPKPEQKSTPVAQQPVRKSEAPKAPAQKPTRDIDNEFDDTPIGMLTGAEGNFRDKKLGNYTYKGQMNAKDSDRLNRGERESLQGDPEINRATANLINAIKSASQRGLKGEAEIYKDPTVAEADNTLTKLIDDKVAAMRGYNDSPEIMKESLKGDIENAEASPVKKPKPSKPPKFTPVSLTGDGAIYRNNETGEEEEVPISEYDRKIVQAQMEADPAKKEAMKRKIITDLLNSKKLNKQLEMFDRDHGEHPQAKDGWAPAYKFLMGKFDRYRPNGEQNEDAFIRWAKKGLRNHALDLIQQEYSQVTDEKTNEKANRKKVSASLDYEVNNGDGDSTTMGETVSDLDRSNGSEKAEKFIRNMLAKETENFANDAAYSTKQLNTLYRIREALDGSPEEVEQRLEELSDLKDSETTDDSRTRQEIIQELLDAHNYLKLGKGKGTAIGKEVQKRINQINQQQKKRTLLAGLSAYYGNDPDPFIDALEETTHVIETEKKNSSGKSRVSERSYGKFTPEEREALREKILSFDRKALESEPEEDQTNKKKSKAKRAVDTQRNVGLGAENLSKFFTYVLGDDAVKGMGFSEGNINEIWNGRNGSLRQYLHDSYKRAMDEEFDRKRPSREDSGEEDSKKEQYSKRSYIDECLSVRLRDIYGRPTLSPTDELDFIYKHRLL